VIACMGSSSESWEPNQAPTSMALTCRVEEPSTASIRDIQALAQVEAKV
jgi:hypothetical protein